MSIQLENIVKNFGQPGGGPVTRVLHDITLEIKAGEFVSITGRSGSGKSTLLYIMSSLDEPTSGEVRIAGKKISSLTVREIHHFRNLNMGFVFQFHHLLPELTVLENILMPALKIKEQDKRKDLALELLNEFGLKEKAHRFPTQISGGEQQRVAIARALIMEPKYVFADEPTGNLDSLNAELVMKLFQKINREKNTSIIYVTHDSDFADLAPRKIQLVDGRVV